MRNWTRSCVFLVHQFRDCLASPLNWQCNSSIKWIFSLLALNGLVKDDWFYGHFLKPSRANDLLSCFHYLQVVPSTNPPCSELLMVKKSHLLCHMGCQVQRILWGCSSIIQGWGCIRIWNFSSHFFIHSSEPDQHSIISQKTSIVSLVSLTSSSQPSSLCVADCWGQELF
jgi:hypothetical protein